MKNNDKILILNLLTKIYDKEIAQKYLDIVINKITILQKVGKPLKTNEIDSDEIMLITYGDSIFNNQNHENPLSTLNNFVTKYLMNYINTIHILPFFPYTSDDGFSISDYTKVNEKMGNWNDVKKINTNFKLMFDLVANHVSKSHIWFNKYLNNEAPFNNYFITCDESFDYSKVFRPRALPLLTKFITTNGEKSVWTTFSSDQVDLNYQNPDLLMEILDVFCLYVEKGATYLRLDAIAFIWKELGTNCIHRDKTHFIIQLIRLMVDLANIDLKIITETNVPHKENISYFGNGYNEASLVYNFPLPPLTLYTFYKEDTSIIMNWIKTLDLKSDKITFFNFLASHDGIGLLPAKDLVSDQEIDKMANKVKENGGYVSYKTDYNGKKVPYEMNVNYFDSLKICGEINLDLEVKRFLASQSILLCLQGVPGIYIHSIIGSRNWIEGVEIHKSNRSINREKIEINLLENHLKDVNSARYKILNGYKKLLKMRQSTPCFSPNAKQNVINNLDNRIFAIERICKNDKVICLTNVSSSSIKTPYNNKKLLDGNNFDGILKPYQVAWFIE